ncbi:hypothetical protein C0995_004454, partial [Termitomyces sp. Mi166
MIILTVNASIVLAAITIDIELVTFPLTADFSITIAMLSTFVTNLSITNTLL